MKVLPFLFLVHFLLFIPVFCESQKYLENGDFEGNNGQDVIPFGWTKCHNQSTPDTQPGSWNVTTSPSKGKSFTNLVTRGDLGPYAHSSEDMQAKFLIPLESNETYVFSMDLANSDSWGHFIGWTDTWVSYADPVVLKVYLGTADCDKSNLVWTSSIVDHTDWKEYSFEVALSSEKQYVILEAFWGSSPDYFGNVLIDDFTIKLKKEDDINESLNSECDLRFPTGFTPNGDGTHEVFGRYQKTNVDAFDFEIQIFNRWGSVVYSSNDLDFSWDGTDGYEKEYSIGTYYFVTQYSCLDNEILVEKQRKGWVALLR